MIETHLPSNVQEVLRNFYTCEATTVNRQGQPVTWPCIPFYYEETGQIILAASIAFPVKAFNARQHPQVSLLFSDPTGTQMERPPFVLVQGDATVSELVDYTGPVAKGLFRTMRRRQPDSQNFTSSRFVRKLFSWYLFQRLLITVQPRRILVWQDGDFNTTPETIEVRNVE